MFLLADRPHLFPGHTLLADTRGPVVDTGIDLQVGGRVYLGRRECAEAARLFGFAAPEQIDAANARIRQLERELGDLGDRLKRAAAIVDDPEADAEAA